MNFEMKMKLDGGGGGGDDKDDVSTSLFRGTSCIGDPQVGQIDTKRTRQIINLIAGKCS